MLRSCRTRRGAPLFAGSGPRRLASVSRWLLRRLLGMTDNDYEWVAAGPSRRLRKLYAQLAAAEAAREQVRTMVFVPEHAPSDFQARRAALRPLDQEVWRLQARIERVSDY